MAFVAGCFIALSVFAGSEAGGAELRAAQGPGNGKPGSGAEAGSGLEKLFGQISRNMGLIEDMLHKQESGEDCQKSQQELVEKIDELIEKLQKMQRSSGKSSGSRGGRSSAGGGSKRDQKPGKQQRKIDQESGRRPEQKGKKEREGGTKKGTGSRESKGKAPNTRAAEGELPPSKPGGTPTEREGGGRWGFLPGEIRARLKAGGRQGLPAKYAGIIRRYFEKLSEEKPE